LIGLLSESECRAAMILHSAGIDTAAVRRHWSQVELRPIQTETAPVLSSAVRSALEAAEVRIGDFMQPFELATEHILFGILASPSSLSAWLNEVGLNAESVEAEVRRQLGCPAGPLAFDEETSLFAGRRTDNGREPLPPAVSDSASGQVGRPATASVEPRASRSNPERGQEQALLRLMDAAANRAREGIRAIEDYCRFIRDDRDLTERLKAFRHDLSAALSHIPPLQLIEARDTRADVGTDLDVEAEHRRGSPADVATANFKRVQEALRSLEEYSKLTPSAAPAPSGRPSTESNGVSPLPRPAWVERAGEGWVERGVGWTGRPPVTSPLPHSATLPLCHSATFPASPFKSLRYRAYTLERDVVIGTQTPRHRWADRLTAARVYVLMDGGPSPAAFARLAEALVHAGADVLQLRDKRLDDRTLLERARTLRDVTARSSTLFIMNDRPDLARLAGADGVHVGQSELSVADARRIAGDGMIVGVSTHSIEQARQAVLDGADYIGVGPTFPSDTKAFDQYPGPELLRAVAREIDLPAFAIGGIRPENVERVLEAGVRRIAVSQAVLAAEDPAEAVDRLRAVLAAR
jgi:thiamine-phosphate pyrophosphorylase